MIRILIVLLISFPIYSQVFTVGVENIKYDPYYNYSPTNLDSRASGASYIDTDIFTEFEKYSGHTLKTVILPVARLFSTFLDENSKLDFKYPDNAKWESHRREGLKIYYAKTIGFIDGIVIYKSKKNDSIKEIATIAGFEPWPLINDPNFNLQNVKSLISGLRILQIHRVDGLYANIEVIKRTYNINSEFSDNGSFDDLLTFANFLPHSKDYYFLSTIKYPEIIKQFDEFVNKTDIITKLRKKYKIKTVY